jgi:hypothetical protein
MGKRPELPYNAGIFAFKSRHFPLFRVSGAVFGKNDDFSRVVHKFPQKKHFLACKESPNMPQ